MAVKVGIPRALGYYYLYPFYKTFLEHLGAEVVVSPETTKATLDRMESCPTDEPCVAVKLYFAHTEKLAQSGADFIFSPVLVSLEKDNFCCPKFLGISDMVRNGLGIDEERFLAPRFDHRLGGEEAIKPFFEVAARLGVTDRGAIHQALRTAEHAQHEYEALMVNQRLTIPEAFQNLVASCQLPVASGSPPHPAFGHPLPPAGEGIGRRAPSPVSASDTGEGWGEGKSGILNLKSEIGLIGHPYILYDMLSHDMVDRLREFGDVVTGEMVPREISREAIRGIYEGNRMWSFESHLLGAAFHLLRNHLVDKMILVGSFECGPESIIESYVEEEAERQEIPFLLLTVDEQTGEAGLVTRIEAFMDTSVASCQLPVASTEIGHKGGEFSLNPLGDLGVLAVPKAHSDLLVGFPSMGYLDVAIRAILEDCGTTCLRTPRTSKRSIELGRELAPEFVCFPFTATLGQMRELLEDGANTLVMISGKGRCRLGWYAQVQEQLLRRAGYDFEMVDLGSPFPIGLHWEHFRDGIKHITQGASWPKIVKAIYFGYRKMAALDHAESICHKVRAVERERGTVDKLFDRFVRRTDRASDLRTIKRKSHEFEEAVRAVEIEDTNPLKVRIVGEIWVVLEHFVNQEIEKMLASQENIRVEVDRGLSATSWFRRNVISDPTLMAREHQIQEAASRYLTEQVGGHGQESVGETVLAREEGCDGVIHIFPFTCMPEIVAQNILVKVSEELDIPVLTFIVSEQTGEAGMQTRVEAFLDVLEDRRKHKNHGALE